MYYLFILKVGRNEVFQVLLGIHIVHSYYHYRDYRVLLIAHSYYHYRDYRVLLIVHSYYHNRDYRVLLIAHTYNNNRILL